MTFIRLPITLLLSLLLTCSASAWADENVKIHLKWLHQFQSAGYLVALEHGFYRDEGLNVELIEGGPDRSPMHALESGDGEYVVTDTGALLYRASGMPIVVLANIFQHSAQVVLCRSDGDVETPADLRGKRIMLQDGFLTIEVIAVLEKFGVHLSQGDVIRQPIGSLDALILGNTDAYAGYSTNEPFLLKQQKIPFKMFSPRDYGIDFYGDMLVTSEQEVRTHSERTEKVLRATLKGWAYALKHPDETIELIMEKYNTQHKTRAHLVFEATEISKFMLSDVIQIGYINPKRWQDIAKVYEGFGLLPKNFSLEGFLYQPQTSWEGLLKANKWQVIVVLLLFLLAILLLHWFLQRYAIMQKTESLLENNKRLNDEIGERKRIEDKLIQAKQDAEQASEAKSEFLSVMSHELRTPLHGIIGLLDMMRDGLHPEQKQDFHMAHQSARSLQTLVSDLLDLSKVEAGKLVLNHKAFDFKACICDVLRTFIVAVNRKDVELSAEFIAAPKMIYGDEVRIRQVLINLVGNAVKFTDIGRVHIRISCDQRGSEHVLNISVSDTGYGISSKDLETIFEPFKQVESLMHRAHGGTGLGTTIAKRLVENLGGKITVESQLGEGSVFSFWIPCDASEDTYSCHVNVCDMDRMPLPVQESHEGLMKNEEGWHILLAEDDLISQRVAMKRLKKSGLQAELAKDGTEAWKMFLNNDYDLILMDLRMPGMDGLSLTRKIRSYEAITDHYTYIIGLSAHALEDMQQECLDAGMDMFLTKPIEPESIIVHVRKMLESL
ncbi:MAG: ABC transporter substrate-binding protein [Mariprofundaceae bacterium]|nr:ABC transporter substrate-binding protein [Mariprofundaceae bacterium]